MTNIKKIYCKSCGKYLGEIRDAKLYKKIVFLCDDCETKRLSSDLANKTKSKNPMDNLFKDLGIF